MGEVTKILGPGEVEGKMQKQTQELPRKTENIHCIIIRITETRILRGSQVFFVLYVLKLCLGVARKRRGNHWEKLSSLKGV